MNKEINDALLPFKDILVQAVWYFVKAPTDVPDWDAQHPKGLPPASDYIGILAGPNGPNDDSRKAQLLHITR